VRENGTVVGSRGVSSGHVLAAITERSVARRASRLLRETRSTYIRRLDDIRGGPCRQWSMVNELLHPDR